MVPRLTCVLVLDCEIVQEERFLVVVDLLRAATQL